MEAAQVWTVIGMGFTLFLWLLNQMRGIDRRMSDGFADIQKQFGDVHRQFGEMHREFGEVHAEIAEVRADLRLHEHRDP